MSCFSSESIKKEQGKGSLHRGRGPQGLGIRCWRAGATEQVGIWRTCRQPFQGWRHSPGQFSRAADLHLPCYQALSWNFVWSNGSVDKNSNTTFIKHLQSSWKSATYRIQVPGDPSTFCFFSPLASVCPCLVSPLLCDQALTCQTRKNSRPSPDLLLEEAASPGTRG